MAVVIKSGIHLGNPNYGPSYRVILNSDNSLEVLGKTKNCKDHKPCDAVVKKVLAIALNIPSAKKPVVQYSIKKNVYGKVAEIVNLIKYGGGKEYSNYYIRSKLGLSSEMTWYYLDKARKAGQVKLEGGYWSAI